MKYIFFYSQLVLSLNQNLKVRGDLVVSKFGI